MWLFCTRCGANYDAEDPTHMAWHAWLDDAVGIYPPPAVDPDPEPTPTPEEP